MISHMTGGPRGSAETSTGWRYAIPVVLVALLGTLISLGLFQRQRMTIAADNAASIQSAVTLTAHQANRSLGSLRGSMAAYPGMQAVTEMSSPDFRRFTRATFANRDDVNAVLLAEADADGMPVTSVVGAKAATFVGFDLLEDPVSAEAIRLAGASKETVLVGRRSSPLGGPAAIFAYTPLFEGGQPAGVVVAAVDVASWMAQASEGTDDDIFGLALVDGSIAPGEVLWSNAAVPVSDHSITSALPLSPLQTLQVSGAAAPGLAAGTPSWRPWAALIIGLLVTGAVCSLLWWWLDARRIKRTADDLQQATNRLRFLAERDALTGLTHRDGLRSWLEDWDNRNPDRPMGILYIDLDGFKEINSTWGHFNGDLVLRQIAHRLSTLADDRDSVVARLASDQFVLLRPLDHGDLDQLALAVQALINEPIPIGDRDIQLTSSIGVAVRPEDGNNLDALVNNADIAMRLAKDVPLDSVVRFDPAMAIGVAQQQQLGREVRAAVRDPDRHFQLDYQPQVDMRTGRLVAAEALVRWRRAGLWVSPGEFLPVASAYGLMPDLGRWILRRACLTVREWRTAVPAVVAVNVDTQQLDAGFADVMAAVLQETGTSPEWLIVEITEGAAMGRRAQRELDRVRALGVSISIDDFGTGFSSLSRLADLPTTQLKIDRAFVQGLGQSNETLEIIRTIVALADALHLEVLAEGVETVAQAQALLAEGIHQAQGFLFASPMPAQQCLDYWHRGVSVPESLFA